MSDSDTTTDTTGAEGYTLATHDETTLDATIVYGGASLRMLAVETDKDVVDITFDFGDPVIAFHIDHVNGVGEFQPSGNPLDEAQLHLIDLLFMNLDAAIPPSDQRTRVEDAAVRQASLLQIIPTGEYLAEGTFRSERGWQAISCSCSSQNLGGNWRTCGKGCGCTGGSGNGCKGRCGQGCGITSWPACSGNTSYTVDCGKHDYGLGSWWAASDDYSWGPNNCSCGGVGSCY